MNDILSELEGKDYTEGRIAVARGDGIKQENPQI